MIQMRSNIMRRRKGATAGAVVIASLLMFAFQNCAKHDQASTPASEQALLFEDVSKKAKAILKAYGFPSSEVALEDHGLIVPGKPELSSLYIDFVDGIEPAGQDRLTDDELSAIRDWIALMGDVWDTVIAPPAVDGNGQPLEPGTFQYVVLTIFMPKCGNCHSQVTAASGGGLDLSNYDQVLARVDAPGNQSPNPQPQANHILTRVQLQGAGAMPPPPGLPLIQSEMIAIQDWIDLGAPNN